MTDRYFTGTSHIVPVNGHRKQDERYLNQRERELLMSALHAAYLDAVDLNTSYRDQTILRELCQSVTDPAHAVMIVEAH